MAKRGFTLIELMVAVSILSIGIVAVLRSFCNSVTVLETMRNRIMALRFLDEKMGEIEQRAWEQEGIAEESQEAGISLGNRQAVYKLEVAVLEPEEEIEEGTEEENISEVKLSLFWKEAGREKDETVAIYLPVKK